MKKMLVLLLVLSMAVALSACGQDKPGETDEIDFPTRQIRFIVGYEPGGTSDGICRLLAAYMTEELGQPVIIENMPGASNLVALNATVAAPDDGYTITMCASADSPWAYAVTMPDDISWKAEDFTVLARMTSAPSSMGVIVDRKRGWETFVDFINDVKAAPPGTFNYGILGPGRLDDPQLHELQELLGVQFNVVHYTSSNSIQTDILTGDLDAGTIGCNRDNFINNENFRVLALYGESIPEGYPDRGLPFLADYEEELGFEFDDAKFIPLENGGTSIICRSSIDPRIQQIYIEALERVNANEEYREKMMTMSFPNMMHTEEALEFYAGIQEALKAGLELQGKQ